MYTYSNNTCCIRPRCSFSQATKLTHHCYSCHFRAKIWKPSNNVKTTIPPLEIFILPCVPNAKLADGSGFHSHKLKVDLQCLQPPFGEFFLVQCLNFDAAAQHRKITEIAQRPFTTTSNHCWHFCRYTAIGCLQMLSSAQTDATDYYPKSKPLALSMR